MDLEKFVKTFGDLTEEEIVTGCHAVAPSITTYEQAELFLWKIVRGLVDSNRPKAASKMVKGLGWGDEIKKTVDYITEAHPELSASQAKLRYFVQEFLE